MNIAVKETQLLLKAPLVIATLEGIKTMTRRLQGLELVNENPDVWSVIRRTEKVEPTSDGGTQEFPGARPDSWLALKNPAGVEDFGFLCLRCPYGDVGDRLWVREAFQPLFAEGWESGSKGDEAACWKTGKGYAPSYVATDGVREFVDAETDEISQRIWPSIHMPRWACRLVLEIVSIRVERLQDISEADAMAEGVHSDDDYPTTSACPSCGGEGTYEALASSLGAMEVGCNECATARQRFKHLWASINGAESWAANPWCWVIEFKKVAA